VLITAEFCYFDVYNSQGRRATYLRCGGRRNWLKQLRLTNNANKSKFLQNSGRILVQVFLVQEKELAELFLCVFFSCKSRRFLLFYFILFYMGEPLKRIFEIAQHLPSYERM